MEIWMRNFVLGVALIMLVSGFSSAMYAEPYLVNELDKGSEIRAVVFYERDLSASFLEEDYPANFNYKFYVENVNESILNTSNLERIYYDYPLKSEGYYASDAFEGLSVSDEMINGTGYSVCLVDTGVNY